jgi:nitrate/nitrite transport system substrate-binding protein
MKEIGYQHGGRNDDPEKLFDGTFDPKDPEGYARSFTINSLKEMA